MNARTGREEYLQQAEAIMRHIQRGDIYEMNFCLEFFAEDVSIHPASTWLALNARSPMPFACYYRSTDFHLLCASPERFLKRTGKRILSQPIKGTAPRGKDAESDRMQRNKLAADEKEMAENIMIVDLVRNDLSRTAVRGSVKVDELMGIHTFPALHQMISTVSAEVEEHTPATDIIRAAFPMGSMTGAPKVRAMQLIEQYENARRGLFSGSVGYFTPGGDFDLNVVIRSIQYREDRYLSFSAGSAITVRSDAAKEYEECLLKAKTMMNVLANAE